MATNTSDKKFLTSQLTTLSHPLTSSTLPFPLLQALNASNTRHLKLKLSSHTIRACVQQLGTLREGALREREKRTERERGGRVRVRRGDQTWWEELPTEWPVIGEGEVDEASRYSTLLDKVKAIKRATSLAEQQLAHYKHLESLTASLTPDLMQRNDAMDPESALRRALDESDSLLVDVETEGLAAMKKRRRTPGTEEGPDSKRARPEADTEAMSSLRRLLD